MAENRVFLPQEAVDVWLAEERVEKIGKLKLPYTRQFKDRLTGRMPHSAKTF